nr:MAG TPA: gamma delta Resolvase, site specific recombination [Caudoviricetes sp.]
MRYAYVRVSCADKQEFDRQELILKDYNIDRLFEEKISGTKKACGRERFAEMLEVLKAGDEIYFESMSRMARSMQDLIETTNILVKKYGVKVIFIKENVKIGGDSTGMDAMTALVFHIMGAFAQFERDLISDRTKDGLKAKKALGVKLGRKRQIDEATEAAIVKAYGTGNGVTYESVAKQFGVSKYTVRDYVRRSMQ